MSQQRIIFIGDIHGCYAELQELLAKVKFDKENDRLISLGDLMHKGCQSAEVIQFFMDLDCEVIMGNHDYYFLQTLKGEKGPYDEFDDIMEELKSIDLQKLINWFSANPLYIDDPKFIAVHGGVNPHDIPLEDHHIDTLLKMRYWDLENNQSVAKINNDNRDHDLRPWFDLLKPGSYNNRPIFFGHWAQKNVQQVGQVIGLDTGCCYGGKLSAYILPTQEIIQVESQHPKQFDY